MSRCKKFMAPEERAGKKERRRDGRKGKSGSEWQDRRVGEKIKIEKTLNRGRPRMISRLKNLLHSLYSPFLTHRERPFGHGASSSHSIPFPSIAIYSPARFHIALDRPLAIIHFTERVNAEVKCWAGGKKSEKEEEQKNRIKLVENEKL